MIMTIIAAIGILWLLISLERGLSVIKADIKKNKLKLWKVRWWNRWTRDFLISVAVILLGTILFAGVTGMVIGLIASVMISAYIQISSKLRKKGATA